MPVYEQPKGLCKALIHLGRGLHIRNNCRAVRTQKINPIKGTAILEKKSQQNA